MDLASAQVIGAGLAAIGAGAAAERNAVEEVRAKVASAAALASRELIAKKHGEAEDRQLADRIIAEL